MIRAHGACRRLLQGSAPLLAGALLACASGEAAHQPGLPRPAWLLDPPPGCAVGSSGPTLDPGDAIRRARTRALEQLAAELLGVQIESELRISADGASEITEQEISGVIANSRVVAMGSGGASLAAGQPATRASVHALACPADTPTPSVPEPGYPAWILNIPSEPGRICAAGVGGPTRKPEQQSDAALRDARRALAQALESRVQRLTLDDGRGLAHVASETASTERARALAEALHSLEAEWMDEDGRGPLGLRGVLYGLLCSEL